MSRGKEVPSRPGFRWYPGWKECHCGQERGQNASLSTELSASGQRPLAGEYSGVGYPMRIIRTRVSRCPESSVTTHSDEDAHRWNSDQLLMLSRTSAPAAGYDHSDSSRPGLTYFEVSHLHWQCCGHWSSPPCKLSGDCGIRFHLALLPIIDIHPHLAQSLITIDRTNPRRRSDFLKLPQWAGPGPGPRVRAVVRHCCLDEKFPRIRVPCFRDRPLGLRLTRRML